MWTLERNLDASSLMYVANPVSPPWDTQNSMDSFAKHSWEAQLGGMAAAAAWWMRIA